MGLIDNFSPEVPLQPGDDVLEVQRDFILKDGRNEVSVLISFSFQVVLMFVYPYRFKVSVTVKGQPLLDRLRLVTPSSENCYLLIVRGLVQTDPENGTQYVLVWSETGCCEVHPGATSSNKDVTALIDKSNRLEKACLLKEKLQVISTLYNTSLLSYYQISF